MSWSISNNDSSSINLSSADNDDATISPGLFNLTAIAEDGSTVPERNEPLTVFYLCVLCITTVIGNVGNILVIGAVLTDRRLHKECNMFIMNLAIADLCVTAIVDPFSIAGVFVGPEFWEVHDGLCHMIGSICLISCVCSLWSIAAISLNRYILICKHSLYRKIYTYKNTAYIIIALWIAATLLDLPNFLDWGDHVYDMKTMACSYDRTASYSYTIFFITMFVSLPLLTVLYCNIQIYVVVRISSIKVSSHRKVGVWIIDGSTMDRKPDTSLMPCQDGDKAVSKSKMVKPRKNQVSITHSTNLNNQLQVPSITPVDGNSQKREQTKNNQLKDEQPSKELNCRIAKKAKAEIKLAKTLFLVFIIFCICWTPYALMCLIDRYDQFSIDAYTIAILTAHSSSTLNSILYALTNKGFRDGYAVFLRKCRCPI